MQFDEPMMQEVCLKVMRMAVAQQISRHGLECLRDVDVAAMIDQHTGHMVMKLCARLLGDSDTKEVKAAGDCVYVPDGWWQAFRERWAPRWWLRRWPVRQRPIVIQYIERHEHIRVCPHIRVPEDRSHLHFLIQKSPDGVHGWES